MQEFYGGREYAITEGHNSWELPSRLALDEAAGLIGINVDTAPPTQSSRIEDEWEERL